MSKQKPSEFAAEANNYTETHIGTRVAAHIDEGNEVRAQFKAAALDEFVSLQTEIEKLLVENYPTLAEHTSVRITFK